MKAPGTVAKIVAVAVLSAASIAVARGPRLRPRLQLAGERPALGAEGVDRHDGLALAPNLLPSAGSQSVSYVDDDAALGGDGLSWSTAFRYLQDALAAASTSGGTVSEIRVAQGTYKPDQDEAGTVTPGDRDATFQLIDGVGLHGGYAGIGASDPDERDIAAYETVLSGDLLGNDGSNFANNDENSYHVVNGRGTGFTTVLEGFTVSGGNANGIAWPEDTGGGLIASHSSLTLCACRFIDNWASWGGGVFIFPDWPYPQPGRITHCAFIANRGDGLDVYDHDLMIDNCVFIGNDYGLVNESDYLSEVTAINCTFSQNSSCGVLITGTHSAYLYTTLTNCVLWDSASGGDQICQWSLGTTIVTYSCIEGGWNWPSGPGNIDEDPLFVNPGYWDDNGTPQDSSDDIWVDGDYHLTANSPCIDIGDPGLDGQDLLDMDREPRVFNGRVDMGIDEYHDCNANGLADYLEIADGTGRDCNGNVVLDECEAGVVPCGGLDVKPGGCPNPLNRSSQGFLPVAVVGTEHFDVTMIDVASVRLSRTDGIGGEVMPHEGPPGPHSVFEDVATPFDGVPGDCHGLAGDGLDDLSMKFSTQNIVAGLELGGLTGGDAVELVVTGTLLDGTSFTTGSDCVVIVPIGNTAVRARANPHESAFSERPQITWRSRP